MNTEYEIAMREIRMKVIRDNFKWVEHAMKKHHNLVAWIDESEECIKISHTIPTHDNVTPAKG